MAVPLMRSYTTAVVGAINTFALANDDITGLSVQQLNRSNEILDETFTINRVKYAVMPIGINTTTPVIK